MTIQQTFQLALQHHQSGRLPEAEALYRKILATDPCHAEAFHYLGIIACQVGRRDVAVDLIRKAIVLRADYPEAHYNLGNAFKEAGQLDEAIEAWRQAVGYRPNYAEAHSNLSIALRDKGLLEEAIAAGRRAVALRPDFAEAHYNLGNALKETGRLPESIDAYRRSIEIKPAFAGAHNNLGVVLKDKGQVEEAVAAYRQAIALKPDFADAHNNLGIALKERGQMEEAIAAYRHATALNPNFSEAHSNLGNALKDNGQLEEAIAAHRQAIALAPEIADAHFNLGNALETNGQSDEANAAAREAIALKPDFADAHFNLALSLLQRGQFAEGWEEYEWRWRTKGFLFSQRNFAQPQWDGSPLEGRTILLHDEQGFGDTLQFIRYLPMVSERGGKIIVECQTAIRRLLQSMVPSHPVVARGQPLPPFDVHCPLLSLPRLFATDLTNIPQGVPYLHPDAAEVEVWRDRLADPSAPLRVGLAWAGSPTHRNDRNRSLKLASLAPLAQISGIRCISLQKGQAAEEAQSPPAGMDLINVADELRDFADTAALVATLDLVIAVDTSVVHLAGAMGKPVWVLLPFAPDWRWLLHREDCPWYPTMRLFRQQHPGDWEPVIASVHSELQLLVQSRS
ncbi:MAG: tetratricopeptide repeat protein [Verrucomicrobiota bacterium]|nr:MAG: tetratricopeptide repeat protein [Verrucomicrobiota bacterium]